MQGLLHAGHRFSYLLRQPNSSTPFRCSAGLLSFNAFERSQSTVLGCLGTRRAYLKALHVAAKLRYSCLLIYPACLLAVCKHTISQERQQTKHPTVATGDRQRA